MADPRARLLIVDDNRVNRLLLGRGVELLGYHASVAENGRIAMDHLRAEPFDLLLLDIEMPEMDGFEVLEAIKRDPALRDLPVIVTSSVEGVDNIVRCIELGAEDYLSKPVNPVLLKARLSSSLEKKRLRDEQKVLLRRFATTEVVQDLAEQGFVLGGHRVYASILFCDIRGFTAISERQPPEETIELLNLYYTLMFEAIDSHGGIVTLMIGDGLMVLFGAPQPLDNPAANAVAAAQDMLAMMDQFNLDRAAAQKPEIKLGIGIATGEVVAGYAGTQARATYTCIGDKVNLASRLEAHTKTVASRILIDEDTKCALTQPQNVASIGHVLFNGFSNPVAVFSIDDS
ncbi:MAG: adenylate/guanylate cyclase domain-containing protein [Cypionkella sp.]